MTEDSASKYLYTVQKVRMDNKTYGPKHYSMDGDRTICGMPINENWYILTNRFDGVATCKNCVGRSIVFPI